MSRESWFAWISTSSISLAAIIRSPPVPAVHVSIIRQSAVPFLACRESMRDRVEITYALIRIVAGFLFLCHGLQKGFGAFGGQRMPLASLFGAAGVIETVCGSLIPLSRL